MSRLIFVANFATKFLPMYTTTLGYREPAYVSIMRKYDTTKMRRKKRSSIFLNLTGRRMKKLLRRHMFKSLNRSFR